MAADTIHTKDTLFDLVNRVLMYVGLPINTFDLDNVLNTSDAGMVRQLLLAQNRLVQTKGWWFNTWEKWKIEADSSRFHDVLILSAQPTPLSCFNTQGDHRELNQTTNALELPLELQIGQRDVVNPAYFDIVYTVNPEDCPVSFREYIVMKTARIYGRSIGVKLDRFDEQDAFAQITVEHERSTPHRNWFKESSIAGY